MPTQAERREATRARLLDAAETLFVARGYEATYVSGQPIFERGVATGNLPGQLIRR